MEGDDPVIIQCQKRVGILISGKWRLDALIGVGGMAAVYMATHRNGSVAAIKILHEEVALNEEVRERFLREAYIANKVGHEGTVKVLDDDTDEGGAPYLVMELLQGDSVEGRADKCGGRLSVDETLDILDQTLAVLESAHAHEIVHRDLKPENLFLINNGRVKVLDFGIARLREDNARKTQTGMVMGTPSFMAPEQAMGRWDEVDQRTDLWAMGATAFTLLTGQPVHEAETAGEMLVAAATRPARSLARLLQGAPFPLVALVDKALAYERENRFPNAAAFRQELAQVRAALGEEGGANIVPTEGAPVQAVIPATVIGASKPEYDREERDQKVDTYDTSQNTPDEIENMREVFTLLERALVAKKQYGDAHPEVKRRFDVCFRQLGSALMTCDICLAWNLTPYAFTAGEETIWEPELPWNRIPYQLFSDGVRTMGLVPGLDEVEFQEWVGLITLDPTVDLAPEDDLVTRLWDQGFMNVFHQAIDSFAEGNQDQRAAYEQQRNDIIDGAKLDHKDGLNDAWEHGKGSAKKDRSGEVLGFLNKNQPLDAEAAARAQNLDIQNASEEEAQAAESINLDDSTRALLGARLDLDVGATSQRFVVAAAEAFVASAKMGRSAAVTAPLRRAVDGLSAGEPEKAMDMILELRETVKVEGKEKETEKLRGTITAEVLSPGTLVDILKGSRELNEDRRAEYMRGLSKVLQCIQSQHFESAIEFLPDAPEGKVRQLLLEFIQRAGAGQEMKIAALFDRADVELGLELVRLLSRVETPEARDAIATASQSPHPLVRIEALGHLEGVSSVRLRNELAKLLEDDDSHVRLAALQAMQDHGIAAAGPFLVLRIQDSGFIKLPYEEKRQSLQTLGAMRPKRAEELCVNLLSESRLIRTDAFDGTRELAAQILAEIATTNESYHLLTSVAESSGFRNSKRVRDAAQAALDRIQKRAEEAEAQAHERKTKAAEERKTKAGEQRKTKPARPSQEGEVRKTGVKKKRRVRKSKVAGEAGERRTRAAKKDGAGGPAEPSAAGGKQ